MMMKFLQEEQKLWKKGYKYVVGLDEAGRGPLAGPVVAAAVILQFSNDKFLIQEQIQNLKIRDSKKLSLEKREEIYKVLTACPKIEWGIARISQKTIDRINIFEATKLAMEKATINLIKKLNKNRDKSCSKIHDREILDKPCFLILDGNFKLDLIDEKLEVGGKIKFRQKPIIKADEKVLSAMIAGIFAKVYRDRIMKNYAKKFPEYGFEKNKGYPTKKHLLAIKKYGPSPTHRKTFKGVV